MRKALVLILCFGSLNLYAQERILKSDPPPEGQWQSGIQPLINFNYKLKKFDFNASFRIQTEIHEKLLWYDEEPQSDWGFKGGRVDLRAFVARQYATNMKFGIGYMTRFTDNGPLQRFIQQVTWINSLQRLSVGQRLRLEQNIIKGWTFASIRPRYRLSMVKSFKGENLNDKEFYLKLNSEVVLKYNLRNKDPRTLRNIDEAQFRINPLIGFKRTSSNKLEFGVEYQFRKEISEFYSGFNDHRTYLVLNWYFAENSK